MYDSMIQHGESGVDRILNWAGSPLGFMNGQLPGEIIWLRDHFIPAREREINTNSENIGDDGKVLGNDRISAFRYLISQGNFSLNGTVEWIRKDYWGQDSYRFP